MSEPKLRAKDPDLAARWLAVWPRINALRMATLTVAEFRWLEEQRGRAGYDPYEVGWYGAAQNAETIAALERFEEEHRGGVRGMSASEARGE
jgi:hypothetical protein